MAFGHTDSESFSINVGESSLGALSLEDLTPRHELVFLDESILNYQALIDSSKAGTEIFLLDSSQDGINQISNILSGYSNLDAVHVVSHGNSGS